MTDDSDHPGAAPTVVTTRGEIRAAVSEARAAGKSIGLVPTMGALHPGHLSLVEASTAECDLTVVTIFVNPAQFGPEEDLDKYPRALQADLEALAAYGVDLVFAPSNDEIYRPGSSTFVEPPKEALPLEGQCRPGHFRGVTTVVLKLFNLIPADVAYFGDKDYQQSVVIRRMAEDLDLPIRIVVCPTVREADNLALSSRNVYLGDDQRQQALALHRCLTRAAELIQQGQDDPAAILSEMRQVLTDAGISRIDYVALVERDTLNEAPRITGPMVALVAAFVGETRLIDNVPIG